jgi:hypothetical protein
MEAYCAHTQKNKEANWKAHARADDYRKFLVKVSQLISVSALKKGEK